ncbi:phosphoethanolamine N-methyltransferase-like [Plakobranchus ocellatus]|uniref:phosphoethanolamine N-methyltransferase n=1 Tax=Plakobranchus ocellatus TaxID=259542 RepID=A0AAV4C0E9_9GAST|nr:phosphoethanolamine N-methyltransferase-like [Plakobranchus ocellatus]
MKLNILGLREVRWKGAGKITSGGHKIIYSGGTESEKRVGIVVDQTASKAIKGYWALSDRVLLAKIAGKPVDLNIIQVYAPTANSNDEDLDKFYNDLDTAKTQCKSQVPLIIMGDFNTKVSTEKVDDIVGKHGLGIRNDRELRSAMTHYWEEHSKEASVEEMMLDSSAAELTKEEIPEILSYLPDYRGKTVLELGAGIGRFTSELAKSAKKVIAVDFMESFLNKNRKENQHFDNIEFIASDVTKLVQPEESFFFLYACFSNEGDKKRGENPTRYRDPEIYEAFYSSVQLPRDSDSIYGYDLVVSKSVDTYVKLKNNVNQVLWLIQKVKKDKSSNQGYKSFQEFLDSQQYSARSILLYERIFGYTFVSTGGLETTQEFVKLLNLKPGQEVLDVGGGIGGGAFYMSKSVRGWHVLQWLRPRCTVACESALRSAGTLLSRARVPGGGL